MKSSFAVLAFMLLMMSAAQAVELRRNEAPAPVDIIKIPEPRGIR